MPKQNAAGENIGAVCTKCKLTLDHTVVAMVDGKIAKVKCKTCGSTHKYKDPSDTAKAKPRAPRAKAGSSASVKATAWQTALSEAKGSEKEYSMNAKFRVGDVVNHASFGKGIVRKLYVNKCDILFQDYERLMVSANV